MSLLRVTCALLGLGIASAMPASADQTDARLEHLFAQLLQSDSVQEARLLEGRIWSIWLRAPDPQAAILLEQGVRAMSSGEVNEAVSRFDLLVMASPGFAEGWNKRATALYMREDYAASMRDIERTLALEPRHFGAISGMGMILMATGDPVGAIAAFEAVLAIHPNAIGARRYLELLRKGLAGGGA